MGERRLFRLAPEALQLTALWVPSQGWQLTVAMRRGDESWSEAKKDTYYGLVTDELVDTAAAAIAVLLLGAAPAD